MNDTYAILIILLAKIAMIIATMAFFISPMLNNFSMQLTFSNVEGSRVEELHKLGQLLVTSQHLGPLHTLAIYKDDVSLNECCPVLKFHKEYRDEASLVLANGRF